MPSRTEPPRTSVIITSYNYARYLSAAMASVLAQTDRDFELIIVDDSSTDDSAAVVRACEDPRVHLIVQPHSGLGAARNNGMRAASGRYIAFLDADDIWTKDKLARQCEILDRDPAIGLVYTRFGIIDTDGRIQSSGYSYFSAMRSGALLRFLVTGNVVGTPSTVCFRRALVEAHEANFDETDMYIEDWQFYLQLAPHCAFSYIPRTLAFHRLHDRNMQAALLINLTQSLNTARFGLTQARRFLSVKDPDVGQLDRKVQAYIDAMAGREYVKVGRLDLARLHAARSLRQYPWSITELVLYVLASLGWVPQNVRRHLK